MGPYTDQQLQAAWTRYVVLNQNDVFYFTNPQSSGYDASFSAILGYIYKNGLFGFANYNSPAAGSNQFPGNNAIVNGPTKS
jgi:hypothetical protein